MFSVMESTYPSSFRSEDVEHLVSRIRSRSSVVLIGMKRVGISNFLRFFLHHPAIRIQYPGLASHIFISVDLRNLVELTPYAFWILTLKKIADTITNGTYTQEMKDECKVLFTQSIQLHDTFFTIEAIRKLLEHLGEVGPTTLFLLRFDRLGGVLTPQFIANLHGLTDSASHVQVVLTSYRPLPSLNPTALSASDLSEFLHEDYIKPALPEDAHAILESLLVHYQLALSPSTRKEIITLCGGHMQMLHLCVLHIQHHALDNTRPLLEQFAQSESIALLCEEIIGNLSPEERHDLEQIASHPRETSAHQPYLRHTGITTASSLWSPLFSHILLNHPTKVTQQEFTKKELALYTILKTNQETLVEREAIIAAVWPDEIEFGVSDWAIDRLVARVRRKLKLQQKQYVQKLVLRLVFARHEQVNFQYIVQ